MSNAIEFQRNYNKKKFPYDCIICAGRPALYLNQFNIYQATFSCYHSSPPSKPQFTPSKTIKLINIICNVVLIYGIVNDFNQIQGHLTSKNIVMMIEIFYTTSTVIISIFGLFKNKIKIQEQHGLITLFNNRFRFDVNVILTSTSAKKIHDILLYLLLFLLVEEFVMCSIATVIENGDTTLFIRMINIEVLIMFNASIALFALNFLKTYESMFDQCFEDVEKFLDEICKNDETVSRHSILTKLQKFQRLYMCLRRNFQLNEDFVQPDVIMIFSIDVCLLLIGYSYFAVMFASGEVALLRFDINLILKSGAIVGCFAYICFLIERVHTMSGDLLSFLFKCPISKLTALESAQVEILITTLTLQKPELKASDIFTIGTGLLASVSGTVLTYVLVALQFHALWATKEN